MKRTIVQLFLIFLFSCNSNVVFERYKDLPEMIWEKEKLIDFDFPVNDTLKTYHIKALIRYGEGYPFSDLKTHLTFISPSGKVQVLPVNFHIRDSLQNYNGDVSGDLWDLEQEIAGKVKFLEKGTYHFVWQHNMPIRKIPLVIQLGIRIEKENQ